MKGILKDVGYGTVLSLSAGAVSFLLARFAFGRLYYLGVLLPVAMLSLLLVAWLIHLKSDGFFRGAAKAPGGEPPPEPRQDDAKGERLYATFEDGVLPRRTSDPAPVLDARAVLRVLLWSAAELFLASLALHHLAGIGTQFFR